MAELRLNRINKGDSQQDFTNKINVNFSELVESLGGPSGKDGLEGIPGGQGNPGPVGTKGLRGEDGTKWFLSAETPTISDNIREGDYWMSTADSNKVYKLILGGWVYQNINIKADEQFKRIFGVDGPEFRDVITQSSSNPGTNTLVFNSAIPSQSTLNPQYSRMVIETSPGATLSYDSKSQPLLEFSKTNNGATGDYDKSPIFSWASPNTNGYDLAWDVRQGGLDFNVGGNMSIISNSGKLEMKSQKDQISMNIGGLNINTTGDYHLKDTGGSPGILRLVTPNFYLGQGSALYRDIGKISSPISVSKYSDGYDKPVMEVKNYMNSRGDGIHITADYNSGDGYLWNSNVDSASLIRLTKDGQFKISRKIGIRKYFPSPITEGHGTYSGTSYNWFGIFPSIAGGVSGNGRLNWDGDEDIVIVSSAVPNRAIYINVYWLAKYYMQTRQSISFSVKTNNASETFNAVGIGTGESSGDYYPDSASLGEFDILTDGAFIIDFHVVRNTNASFGIDQTFSVYYEARGTSADEFQTGVLYNT